MHITTVTQGENGWYAAAGCLEHDAAWQWEAPCLVHNACFQEVLKSSQQSCDCVVHKTLIVMILSDACGLT